MTCRPLFVFLACAPLVAPLAAQSPSAPLTKASPEQLRRWLRQYPEADANRDGSLTVEEAEAFRRRREAQPTRPLPRPGFRHEFTFATMSDGVRIALAVGYPKEFDPSAKDRKWPAVFSTCGYPTVVVPAAPAGYGDRYVTVNASIRGTGASGGALQPWGERTRQDGYEIIENWIAKQPWSNGKAAIHGYSWPGLVGFLTASTQPPSLKAVCVGGLIEDFYRGIARPGGIRNCGFPIDWLSNFYRLDGPFGSGVAAMEARKLDASAYAAIVAMRPERDWAQDTLWLGLHEVFDGPKWQQASLCTHAPRIRAPIMIGHAWQDEQTGPTGWQLWKRVPDDVPKRLFLTNGHHAAGPAPHDNALAWFDRWLLDRPNPQLTDPARRVLCYFETPKGPQGRGVRGAPLAASDFPLPDTKWTTYFLCADRRLTSSPPGGTESTTQYTVAHGDNGPDGRARYELEFPEATAICGPALLTLWAQLNTLDTDFFVLLADEGPDGTLYGLQRGLLRASHRRVDKERAGCVVEIAGRKTAIRPFRPHTAVEPVAPHRPCEFLIEIPAVGHVFRTRHKLIVCITRPPESDPIGVTRSEAPSYRYESHPPPAVVTILHDAKHPSSLVLPVLPKLPPLASQPVPLDEQVGLQPVR